MQRLLDKIKQSGEFPLIIPQKHIHSRYRCKGCHRGVKKEEKIWLCSMHGILSRDQIYDTDRIKDLEAYLNALDITEREPLAFELKEFDTTMEKSWFNYFLRKWLKKKTGKKYSTLPLLQCHIKHRST